MKTYRISILPEKNEYIGIGLMSGSSLDGLDIAAINFKFKNQKLHNFKILEAKTFVYDEKWIARLEHLPFASALNFAKTHVHFGHYMGKKVLDFCKEHKIKPDFVASHGHTIFHQPNKYLTFQIGCGQTLSSYLECPLVNDFRTKDVANGGQGAPLVPLVEKELFPDVSIFINLGGFVNISIYNQNQILGYDITACNRVLNYYAWKFCKKPYDENGLIAKQGNVIEDLLKEIQKISYFHQPPPKSLGNEWLEQNIYPVLDEYVKLYDFPSVMRTWCEHIAYEIKRNLLEYPNFNILMTGGGAKNIFLKHLIQKYISNKLLDVDDKIIDFKEGLVFAYLGLKTLLGQEHETIQQVTGGKNTILGSIHLG